MANETSSSPPGPAAAAARAPVAPGRWRQWRRRALRVFADRTKRRHLTLVALTLVAIGLMAAVKGALGYYVFAGQSTRIEFTLAIAAAIAGVFALGERRIAHALERRFTRNTLQHRQALAELADEIARATDRPTLEQRLVARFDELFGTHGTALLVRGASDPRYLVVASSGVPAVDAVAPDDALAVRLAAVHAPLNPADVGSPLPAALVWPLRMHGQLIGLLIPGEHDYIESFDAAEIDAVTALADTAAANMALLDPDLVALSAARTPHNLPAPLTSFVGRERELAQVRQLLAAARLVTVTGFAGAGKTRLARQLGADALDRFPGGVWWVALDTLTDAAHVPSAVAAAVGVHETHDVSAAAALAHRFGGHPVLLVLDTCDHVRAGCAALVTALLPACPRLTVLATSLTPLGVQGEHEFPLAALAIPPADAGADARALGQCDAVRLFVERARLAAPSFAPDDESVVLIADICRQLDGIPLAIELAAARVKFLGLEAIRDHLDQRFRMLTGGDPALARHQTLRASIEWSHDHLDAAAQVLLRRLAVFSGSFTLAAAAAVATDGGDALDLLDPVTALADKSLLLVDADGNGDPRYRMLATMRQFAREKLAADADGTAVWQRHAAYYVELAERVAPNLRGATAAAALAQLDREFDNVQGAVATLLARSDGGNGAMRVALALAPYWPARGILARGLAVTRDALAHPDAQAPERLRAALLLATARQAFLGGDLAAARGWLAPCTVLAAALPAPDLHVRALALSASVAAREQDRDAARREIDAALAAARALGDDAVLRETLDDAGDLLRRAGDLPAAAAMLGEALALARRAGDAPALHEALRDAARLALERGDLAQAGDLLGEALALAADSGARFDGENDLEVAGQLAAAFEDWTQAARLAGAADAAATAIGTSRAARDDAITAAFGAATRQALGDAAYAAAYADGRALPLVAALAEARAWLAAARALARQRTAAGSAP